LISRLLCFSDADLIQETLERKDPLGISKLKLPASKTCKQSLKERPSATYNQDAVRHIDIQSKGREPDLQGFPK
jgi:hypothetical protein